MRALSPLRAAIKVSAVALLSAGALAGAGAAQAAVAASPASFATGGGLASVAAVSASDAWAAGYSGTTFARKTLLAHWNGKTWTRVTSPAVLNGAYGEIEDVTVVSATDAWAVGSTSNAEGADEHTLILHWNGKTWSVPSTPKPIPGVLSGMTATARSGWAVGSAAGSVPGLLILHWNGTAWSHVTAPASPVGDGYLASVAVTGPHSAWAVGDGLYLHGNVATLEGFLLRWNGKSWSVDPSFPLKGLLNGLGQVAAGPGGTAWAVGQSYGAKSASAISMLWNGKSWVREPSLPAASFDAVTVAPGGTVWAAGASLIAEWSGKSWVQVPIQNPKPASFLQALSFASAASGWAVGYTATPTGSSTLILHWNGKTWS